MKLGLFWLLMPLKVSVLMKSEAVVKFLKGEEVGAWVTNPGEEDQTTGAYAFPGGTLVTVDSTEVDIQCQQPGLFILKMKHVITE